MSDRHQTDSMRDSRKDDIPLLNSYQYSPISWTFYTWNPWIGCVWCAPECNLCYAVLVAARYGVGWGKDADRHFPKDAMAKPYRWNRKAQKTGEVPIVFTASLADVFEDNDQLTERRAEVFKIIEDCTSLDFLLLTKRPDNVKRMVPKEWLDDWPDHVMIGTSVGHPSSYKKLDYLLEIPAKTRVVSAEPLLAEVDFEPWLSKRNEDGSPAIAAVMIGGQTGKTAKAMEPEWARKLIRCCEEHGVIPHFKQHGAYRNESQLAYVGLTVDDVKKRRQHRCKDGTINYRILKIKRRLGDGTERVVSLPQHIFDGRVHLDMPNPRGVKRPSKAPPKDARSPAHPPADLPDTSPTSGCNRQAADSGAGCMDAGCACPSSGTPAPSAGPIVVDAETVSVHLPKAPEPLSLGRVEVTPEVLPPDGESELWDDTITRLPDSALSSATPEQGPDESPQSAETEQATVGIPRFDVFPSTSDQLYAVQPDSGRVLALDTQEFRDALRLKLSRELGHAPTDAALAGELSLLRALAREQPPREVYRRVAHLSGRIIIDLCQPDGRVVDVTQDRYEVLDSSPVLFERTSVMQPWPTPELGGTLADLQALLPLPEQDFAVALGFILATFAPDMPYPGLNITGPAGAGKSVLTRAIKRIVDPSQLPSHVPSRKAGAIHQTARDSTVPAFDNLSSLTQGESDQLATLMTGASVPTGNGNSVFIRRPVLLNGLTNVATRGDLQQRLWSIELPSRDLAEHKIDEPELNEAFEHHGAKAFELILRMLSSALGRRTDVTDTIDTRMAEAARWACAGMLILDWMPSRFLGHLRAQADDSAESEAENNPTIIAVIKLMDGRQEFEGSPSELLEALRGATDGWVRSSLPSQPNGMSRALNEHHGILERYGIKMSQPRRTGSRGRRVKLTKLQDDTKQQEAA
jgi:protein gp37